MQRDERGREKLNNMGTN